MTIGESDIVVPPSKDISRLFTAPSGAWITVLALWLVGGVVLWKYPLALLGYMLVFASWLVYNFQIVKEDERAKPVFLGQIGKLVGSGPVFVLRPFEKLAKYPTGVQQITFAHAGILTQRKGEITPVVLPVTPVLNFQWPWEDRELTLAIRNAPPPDAEGLKELKNKIEEPFLDVVRTVGGQKTYEWIAQNRIRFAEEITGKLKESKDLTGLIRLFQLKNPTVSMKHIEVPETVKSGLETEAAALPKGRASKITEEQKRFGIAAGEEEIRRRIARVITEYPNIGMNIEALITLREMAESGKTTHIIIPQQVYSALSKALGAPAEQAIAGMSDEQFRLLIERIERLERS